MQDKKNCQRSIGSINIVVPYWDLNFWRYWSEISIWLLDVVLDFYMYMETIWPEFQFDCDC